MDKKPDFENGRFYVCFYCRNLMIFPSSSSRFDDSDEHACKLEKKDDGRYPSVVRYEHRTDKLSVIERGCDSFESSGLPAHPVVLRELVRINPRTKSILSDSSATESVGRFDRKIREFLPEEQILEDRNLFYHR